MYEDRQMAGKRYFVVLPAKLLDRRWPRYEPLLARNRWLTRLALGANQRAEQFIVSSS